MSKPAVSQPSSERWVSILDGIEVRLDEAIGAADLRAARLPVASESSIAAKHRTDLSGIAERILDLQGRRTRSQALADDEDLALGVAEDALRRKLAEVALLRQKLAASPGRAIL